MGKAARIAMIGTRGVPARYGGFETAVEEIGRRLAARGHDVVVYCRNEGQTSKRYLGMKLINLPALRFKHAETLSHAAISIGHVALHPCDAAIVFNAANAPLLPGLQLRGVPTALHVDGLEWKRSKWKGAGSRYYQLAERIAVRRADRLIADARAIQDYYHRRYGVGTTFIPYGAPILDNSMSDRLPELGLEAGHYHLIVARMEPENNVHLMVTGYMESASRLPLVVVGSAPHAAKYSAIVRAAAQGSDMVRFVGSVWDQSLLDQLYANSRLYIHGHSVGGTNPSLLRAMGAAAPVAALDVVFNREVLADTGVYFAGSRNLAAILRYAEEDSEALQSRGLEGRRRAAAEYDWEDVTDKYEQLCADLISTRARASRSASREALRVGGSGQERIPVADRGGDAERV